MNWVHPTLVALACLLTVFVQVAWDLPRRLLAVQPDLLPALVAYSGLNAGPGLTCAVAVLGGLSFDSFSANPLGVSILPLAAVGLAIVIALFRHHESLNPEMFRTLKW